MRIKRGFSSILALLLLLIIPLASAEIIINQQPDRIYNLGDMIIIPVTLRSATGAAGNFQMNLICNGQEMNFYKNGVSLPAGEEKRIESSLILSKSIIGNLKGTCTIKAFLGKDFSLTNNFEISDWITINSNLSKMNFNPKENLAIKGNAIKENGKSVNGYIELSILDGNNTVLIKPGTINNGLFLVDMTFPEDISAGNHLLRLRAYEKDLSEEETNTGFIEKSIYINQVPKNLEIVLENAEIEPGTSVKTKAVLYDQTGVKIDSIVFLTIKNNNKILEQVEVSTDESIDFPVAYNEAPSIWKVVAVSNKLTSESDFKILEKEAATVEIINKTVLITNTGNIPYNKTVLVKIGNQSLSIDVYLKVDQSQRWFLTAPDGRYLIEVVADGKITGASIALTGESIDIRKASAGIGSLVKFPVVWIFILAVLGFVAFIFFKRGYQKSFIGYMRADQKKRPMEKAMDFQVYNPKSAKAELELSIKGDEQDASMITLKIKNLELLRRTKESGSEEILKKITEIAEGHKAATYESNDNIFFIFCATRTKTFKNEMTALNAAQKIRDLLHDKNKVLKNKIDFGISINHGSIVAKQESDSFKFMPMGNLMTLSKKIASAAEKEIFMSTRMADLVRTNVRAEKHVRDGTDVYLLKDIKNSEEHEKFLKGFMKRQEK